GRQQGNKPGAAVRRTPRPTGIVVPCQNERAQHKNKSMAMKIVKARLYELERQKQEAKMAELTKGKKEIGFGHQIRSYVLHPYRMVKDHRTGTEIGHADAVLDGQIDAFIDSYPRQRAEGGPAPPPGGLRRRAGARRSATGRGRRAGTGARRARRRRRGRATPTSRRTTPGPSSARRPPGR